MKVVVWLAIWISFGLSVAGMLLSAVLWSKAARNLITEVWIRTAASVEEGGFMLQARVLLSEFIHRLLLDKTGSLSLKKMILWATLSSTLLATASVIPGPNDKGDTDWKEALVMFAVSLPIHLGIEWLFARGFIRRFKATETRNFAYSLLRSFLSGALGLTIVVVPLILVVEMAIQVLIELGQDPNRGPEKFKFALEFIKPVFFSGPGLLYFLLQDWKNPINVSPASLILVFFSACTTFMIVILSAVATAVFRNKYTLRATVSLCEFFEKLDPRVVFSASASVFGIATGLMQAYTFTAP